MPWGRCRQRTLAQTRMLARIVNYIRKPKDQSMNLGTHMPATWTSSAKRALAVSCAILLTISACGVGSVSAAQRQTPSSEPYYLAPNGVTVMCPGVAVGDTFVIGGTTYTKVDQTTLNSLAGSKSTWPQLPTSCTTGVTNTSRLFSVRVPPSSLLLPCRCVIGIACALDLLSPLTSHDHPSLAAL